MDILDPIQHIIEQAPIFILVLFRLAGIMLFAPMLGSVTIPIPIKVFIVLTLSVAVFPLVTETVQTLPPALPSNLVEAAFEVASEMLIGLSMGFALALMFVGIQLGAEMVSQQMALSLARVIDPMTNISTELLSQLYLLMATLIYVLMNGHHALIRALVDTFQVVPLMGAGFDQSIIATFVSILTGAFMLGIRIAGPALAAIFLATIAMGFISRTMPQLNILAAGFPIRICLALVLMIASLGTVFLLVQNTIVNVLSQIGTFFV